VPMTYYPRVTVTKWSGTVERRFESKLRWPTMQHAAAHAKRLREVYDSKYLGIHWAQDDGSGEQFGVDPHSRNVEIAIMCTTDDEPSIFQPVLV
jgi:hypothetical protein